MTLSGSVDTAVFLSYINQVLAPQLWAGAIVVMDNLKVHHAHSLRYAIAAVGARVVFLPPYSRLFVSLNRCVGRNSNSSCVPLLPVLMRHLTKQ